jgi:OFA family oxalate/formate antiporter-like MFS transporter
MGRVDQFSQKGERVRAPKGYVLTRWSIPFAGFLLSLMGGFSYAWGVFILPMEERFGWTKAQSTLPFTVFMVVFAIFMIPAGRMQDKIGPRKVSLAGAILFFISYSLAAFVARFPYVWWLVITYGFLGGIACGLTYACIAPPARKWFPDKPGLAISVGVMGFGLAALILAPLKANYLIPVHGIEGTFLIIGIITSSISLFAAWLTRNPPEGYAPIGWNPGKAAGKTIAIVKETSPRELIASPLFWVIWLTFAFVVSGGLICISLIPSYGKLVVGLSAVEAAIAMSIFSGFNGFGRPLAGFIADKFGVVKIMIITYALQAIVFLLFHAIAVNQPALYICLAFLGWGYAVILALFPTLTSICFGTRHLGINYGIVFTAFGVGALAPTAGSWIHDLTGNFTPVFVSSGFMTVIGLFLCVVLWKKYKVL